MTGEPVRLGRDQNTLMIGSGAHRIIVHDTGTGEFHGNLDDIAVASATDLAKLLSRGPRAGTELLVSSVDRALFDYEFTPAGPITLSADEDGLIVDVLFALDVWDDEHQTSVSASATVAPVLKRHGASPIAVEMDDYSAAAPWLWHFRFRPRTHGKRVGEIYRIGQEVEALLQAVSGGGLTRETVGDLVRGGQASLLIGFSEGDWLDVKKQDYDLTEDGRISLAQDVARFANAELGGVILVGMEARRRGGDEIISKLRPIPYDANAPRRHRHAINHRVYPPPDGLVLEQVMVDDKSALILIDVPPQPEDLKPFLVHGAIRGGNIEGSFISIVRRRGETSIGITAPAIHSQLAAGRALMKRGAVLSDWQDSAPEESQ